MRFGVLGTLEAYNDDGELIRLSGPVRRLLLASLVARAGRTVPVETLIDDLWGESPPPSASKTLQGHMMRLRADIRHPDARRVLVTDPTGYRLAVEPDAVDVGQFEHDLQLGHCSLDADRPDQAVIHLDRAASRWRDDAYLEFTEAAFAAAERQRLAELRSLAREQRTHAALLLGQSAELVPELEARVLAEPYREKGWEQLILALYRSGRQAEALASYRRARARLDEDLGVEPGPTLTALQERILRHDGALLAATIAVGHPGNGQRPAAQLELRNPYSGLARYEESDAALFVARDRLTAELAGRLAEHDLIVLAGVSGVGKSSLVRAGLVPALRAGALPGSPAWRTAVVTPDAVLNPMPGRTVDLLVVDQAEELFTLTDRSGRAVVDRGLAAYLSSGGRLILVVRADFYGSLAALPELGHRVGRSTVLVGPPTETQLRTIVTEPARRVGLTVEPELVEQVLDDVRDQPGALPLLSAALVRAFENREGETLTLAGYRTGGGVAGALEATAEDTYRSMDPAAQAAARILLVRLATREGSGWVRRPLPRTELERIADQPLRRAVAVLADRRLLVVGADRVEVSHEAVLTGWPRLRGWLEDLVLGADLVEHLRSSALAWEQAGRPDADLYRGPRLQAALDWRDQHAADLAPLESAFLDAGARAGETEIAEAHARADSEARGRRRLRTVVVALVAAVAVLLAAGALAAHERSNANAAALTANAGRVAALAQTVPDLTTSMLLATAGYRLQDSATTRAGLLGSLERHASVLWRIPTTDRVLALYVAADGSRLYAMDNQRVVTVYSLPDRHVIATYPARADNITALSPDGTRLVVEGPGSGGNDPQGGGRVTVLDAANGGRIQVLSTLTSQARDVSSGTFTGDGRWFAVIEAKDGNTDQLGPAVDVYNTANWSAGPRVLHLSANVTALAAGTADLMVAAADGTLKTVRAADLSTVSSAKRPDLKELAVVSPDHDSIWVAVAPDDRHAAIATTRAPARLVLLDTRHLGHAGRVVGQQTAPVGLLRFAPDSGRIAVSSSTAIEVYRTDGTLAESLVGATGDVQGLDWAGHGSTTSLYSGGLDSQILSWQVNSAARLLAVSGPSLEVPNLYQTEKFGDHVLASATRDPNHESSMTMFDLDVRTGVERSWPLGLKDDEAPSQVSADLHGRTVIVTVYNQNTQQNTFQVWDVGSERLIGRFGLPPGTIWTDGFPYAIPTADGTQAWETITPRTLALISLPNGKVLRTITTHFGGPDDTKLQDDPFAVDSAGRLLVGGEEGNPPPPPPLNAGPVLPPTVSSVAAPDLPVGVFDPRTGRLLGRTSMTKFALNTWAYSPDGSLIAFASPTGTVTVADAATLRPRQQDVHAASGYVNSVDFSPDGTMVVTGSTEGTFTFWDATTMRQLAAPIRTGDQGSWAWFDPAGDVRGLTGTTSSTGSTGASSTRTFTYPGRPQEWAAAACAVAGTDFTRQDWARYVSTTPYQRVCPEPQRP